MDDTLAPESTRQNLRSQRLNLLTNEPHQRLESLVKSKEPFRQEYRCIAMCCDMANSVGYQFGFMLLCFFDFDTFSTQHAQSSAGIPNF